MEIIPVFLGLTIKDWFIILLIANLMGCIIHIRRLNHALIEEKKKRLLPLLILELDESSPGVYLKNNSSCYAQKIIFEDFPLTLELGYKKMVVLKFETIDTLYPNEKKKLQFRIFDGEYEDYQSEKDNITNYFFISDFQLRLYYYNIENTKFTALITAENNTFHIKEAGIV